MMPAEVEMKSFALWSLALGVLLASPAALAKGGGKPKQVLFFTKSSGWEHDVIKVQDGQPSLAHKVLEELGAANGFVVTHTKDGSVFSPEGIAKYDAFIFYTTGDLTTPGTDKNPPMSPEGKVALLDAIAKGKGFVATHSGADTFHSPGDPFEASGETADPYVKMLGGEFIKHGQQQKAKVFCPDSRFPGFAACKHSFELLEEWYSLKNFAQDLHVLLWLGTWSIKNTGGDSVYRRAPYPVTWARKHGKGRVFYTALGDRADVWANPLFQSMLAGGIKWASGLAAAAVTPNIATVTPGFAELPPNDPPPPKAAAPTAAATPTPPATPR
jgi:type 1 glutamine amidotransferase